MKTVFIDRLNEIKTIKELLTSTKKRAAILLGDGGIGKTRFLQKINEIAEGEYKRQGIKTAIDDFGAGYSGLNLLSEFQPDFIKIDMSLIKDLTKQPMQQSIVEQLVQLGKKYNSQVIAEGVETLKESKLVSKMHVRYAQGFYFARPQALLSS